MGVTVTTTTRDRADAVVRKLMAANPSWGELHDCEEMPNGHLHYLMDDAEVWVEVWLDRTRIRHRIHRENLEPTRGPRARLDI